MKVSEFLRRALGLSSADSLGRSSDEEEAKPISGSASPDQEEDSSGSGTTVPSIKLVVGLGNPGADYEDTRHNIGFRTLERFLEPLADKLTREKGKKAACFSLLHQDRTCWFVKPMTFMNRSGLAVAPLARRLSISPEETLVLHDEVDLEEGRLQIKKGGGMAGHRGLKSIGREWGTQDFYRLRIGVGREKGVEVADYVLEEVPASFLDPIAAKAAKALEAIFERGPDVAMNEVNR